MGSGLDIGILSVSDRASRGDYEDRSGPAIVAYLEGAIRSPITTHLRLVPDECDRIQDAVIDLVHRVHCAWVVVSGGTGPGIRDVTPEAIAGLCDRRLPGFGERMRQASWNKVPTAILSRQEAALRGHSLVLTLPGNPAAIAECLDAVFPAIPHCLELLGWPRLESAAELRPAPH